MKIQAFLKIAVVATAALAAYAFSGNNANNQMTFKRSDTCENIKVGCTNDGDYTCMILIDGQQEPITILDLNCSLEIKHDNSVPFNWPE